MSLQRIDEAFATQSPQSDDYLQPVEKAFAVAFSKLDGNADEVLVKSRKFNIDVPRELQMLKVSSRRYQFY